MPPPLSCVTPPPRALGRRAWPHRQSERAGEAERIAGVTRVPAHQVEIPAHGLRLVAAGDSLDQGERRRHRATDTRRRHHALINNQSPVRDKVDRGYFFALLKIIPLAPAQTPTSLHRTWRPHPGLPRVWSVAKASTGRVTLLLEPKFGFESREQQPTRRLKIVTGNQLRKAAVLNFDEDGSPHVPPTSEYHRNAHLAGVRNCGRLGYGGGRHGRSSLRDAGRGPGGRAHQSAGGRTRGLRQGLARVQR